MSGQFPVSGFQKLARLLDEEGEVFQRHVLDLIRDAVEDEDFHRNNMATLRKQIPEKDIEDFLKSMTADKAHYLRPGPVQDILALAENLKGGHATQHDLALIMASELMHRKRWEKVMEENPDTLKALKNRME